MTDFLIAVIVLLSVLAIIFFLRDKGFGILDKIESWFPLNDEET